MEQRDLHVQRDVLPEQFKGPFVEMDPGCVQSVAVHEWLNYKINENEAKVLYEIFDGRCEKRPTVFVGQYPQDEWYERLGGGAQSESILDRIVYNAYTIQTGETNLRRSL